MASRVVGRSTPAGLTSAPAIVLSNDDLPAPVGPEEQHEQWRIEIRGPRPDKTLEMIAKLTRSFARGRVRWCERQPALREIGKPIAAFDEDGRIGVHVCELYVPLIAGGEPPATPSFRSLATHHSKRPRARCDNSRPRIC
jgi:hypothetical protein